MTGRGPTLELLRGIAAYMETVGLGSVVPEDEAPAADAVRPVYFGPTDRSDMREDRWILTPQIPYMLSRMTEVVPVAFYWRGAKRQDAQDAYDLVDLLRIRLDRLAHVNLGTIRVGLVERQSAGVLPTDTEKRPALSATYLFRRRIETVPAT